MSANLSQVSLAEIYKSKAFEAWSFLKELEKQIEEKKDLLDSIGVNFIISGCTKASGTESGFSQQHFSNSALHMMLEKCPHMTESMEREIKRCFEADSYKKPTIFSNPALFEKMQQEIERQRFKEMREVINWVKRARTPDGYMWKEKNYITIPQVVRLMATPQVSKGTDHWRWRFESAYDNLRKLEIALYSLDNQKLPDRLLADDICKTWEDESKITDYKPDGIKTFSFKSKYFELRAYRKAPDQITFTPKALALLNQEKYHFNKSWEPQKTCSFELNREQKKAIEWIKKSPDTINRKVSQTVRVEGVTLDISKNHNIDFFSDSKEWQNLANLEYALYKLSGKNLPDKFLNELIKETWDIEYREGKRAIYKIPPKERKESIFLAALKLIKTMNFESEFFTLKIYRNSTGEITFTDEALELLNGKNETINAVESEALNAANVEFLQTHNQPEIDPLNEVIEFEKQWLLRRSELRRQACDRQVEKITSQDPKIVSKSEISKALDLIELRIESLDDTNKLSDKSERLLKAKVAQDEAIKKQEAKPKIVIDFSKKEGFIVYGSTREISQDLGRKGLGLAYWGLKKLWYIRGSKGKPWSANYQRFIDGLERVCNKNGMTLDNKIKLAEAA